MKFQAEHGSKLKELHRTQVLSQQICRIVITIDEVDFSQAAVNDLTNVVVPDIDVLRSLFSDRIRGDKNQPSSSMGCFRACHHASPACFSP